MKNYKCECGETFSDPQKFNSHKGHCRIHFEAVGKTIQWMSVFKNRKKQSGKLSWKQNIKYILQIT